MRDYKVGNHYSEREFDCIKCANDYYNELEGLKYLAKCRLGIPIEIICNTYGWSNC